MPTIWITRDEWYPVFTPRTDNEYGDEHDPGITVPDEFIQRHENALSAWNKVQVGLREYHRLEQAATREAEEAARDRLDPIDWDNQPRNT